MLVERGPTAVKRWTTKAVIDIFTCNFVFIPICEEGHWSLCVLVNPGQVLNGTNDSGNEDDLLGCLIFLDPARGYHDKYKVRSNIIRYLNYEWNRSKQSEETPFTSETYPLLTPEGNV
jgi:sentrin-specific protease 7